MALRARPGLPLRTGKAEEEDAGSGGGDEGGGGAVIKMVPTSDAGENNISGYASDKCTMRPRDRATRLLSSGSEVALLNIHELWKNVPIVFNE
jgi:hypothetical protein